MKVLITGGLGFIGYHVAERFSKEGYEVYIIDNLSTGTKEDVHFKHKLYELSVEDTKCEEIFRNNRFDAVVHLAAQVNVVSSIADPRHDSESNVLGLVNMLSLSQKYGAKKFIFASSAAVYGANEHLPISESERANPISPYGISKWVGESYCSKWKELYGLDTLCFRFSNVYGPRQGSKGEGGVVSIFLERLLSGQPLYIRGDGEQTRDFIYVEDVADAIYRASYSSLTGVYNLSTNTECSVNQLAGELKELHGAAEVVYQDPQPGDIRHSRLDNAAVKRDLDWTPMYGVKEGLFRTYTWFSKHAAGREMAAASETKPGSGRAKIRVWMPLVENLVAFALAALLVLSDWNDTVAFIDIRLLYIVVIGIIYGSRQSIVAVALSIGLLIYEKIADGRELVSLFYDTDFFFQTAVYLFVGLVVGYAIERKNRKLQAQQEQIVLLEDKQAFLTGVYNEVRAVKDELQERILSSEDSFGKIYSITKELESLEPELIFNATLNVVESIMKTSDVSIYAVNSDFSYLRLVAQSGGEEAGAKSLKVSEHDYLRDLFENGKPFVNKQLLDHAPALAAPVMNKNEIVAVIFIRSMKFDNFSLYYQNLFKVTVELISSSLSRALSYVEAMRSIRYVDGTAVLNAEAFAAILDSKRQAKEQHSTPYLLLETDCGGMSLKAYADKLSGILRETDYIGEGDEGRLYILLSNTGQEDAPHVMKRFEQHQVPLRLIEEEAAS